MKSPEKILLLPGFLCDARLWQHEVSFLSDHYRAEVIEFQNCANLDEMLAKVKMSAKTPVHVVGFSMGGYISEVFTVQNPELVKSLTLVAANVGELSENTKAARLKMAGVLKNAKYRGIPERDLPKYLHPDSLAKTEIAELIIDMSRGYTSEMYLNQMMATIDREDLGPVIDQLKKNVLIIAGEQDRVVPSADLLQLHKEISGSECHVVRNTGH